MKLSVVHTGLFKLDGGAMYGVVPKQIWNRLNPADELNLCNWAMRCLLVEDGERLILIDTGIGNKQSDKFFGYYHLSQTRALRQAVEEAGYSLDAITDVLLTHLHFDHCGGAVVKSADGQGFEPSCKNARYWLTEAQWNHAMNPNPREQPSFLKENFVPLMEHGCLNFISEHQFLGSTVEIRVVNGHTRGMICPLIHYKDRKIFYTADLIPSASHIPVNYVMGYDIEPLTVMREKEQILLEAEAEQWLLFYEHDPVNMATCIERNEKGGFRASSVMDLATL
jgi:glyoxylase-like metal-dependent hydrolase (beta-lactamase superfamily II)